jgi:hypothetical protein
MSIQVLQEVKNRFAILNSSQALALDQINDALMWGRPRLLSPAGLHLDRRADNHQDYRRL